MTDLSRTIAPKSDQLNSDDLISGPRTVVITAVKANMGSAEQPIDISFDGDGGKPYKPCKGMRRVMVEAWGPDGNAYVGRSMTLYRDPSVTWGGMQVGGIRISAMSHIEADRQFAVTTSKTQRKPLTVKRLARAAAPQGQAKGDDGIDPRLKADALAAADRGSEALRSFWDDLDKQWRAALKPIMADLKARAADADQRAAQPQEREPGDELDEFGLPRLTPADNEQG